MKKIKYLLFGILLSLGVTACSIPYTVMDDYPYGYEMCFVNAYSGYYSCGWYSYDAYRYYHGFLSYRYMNGRHYFYHYNWRNSAGGFMDNPSRFKENPTASMIKGKGATRSQPVEGRSAKPRNEPTPRQPAATPRTAKPRVQPAPVTRQAPPAGRTPARVAKPRVVKPRGGGG